MPATTCPRWRTSPSATRRRAEALAGLLADVLEHPVGAEFAVSEYELSVRHDLRPLVLKTVLTYLELDGVLRQGTPFYAGYRLRPLGDVSLEDVFGRFDESRAGFLRRLIATGKTGRTWTTLAPDEAAAELGEERSRILAALEYLDQQGLVELQPAECAPALHGPRPPGLRAPSSSSACSSASRAGSERRPRGSRTSSRSSPTTAARCAPSSATSARRARSRAGTAATA